MSSISQNLRKQLRQLHSRIGRRKSDVFVCEGLRCCGEALCRRPDWIECALITTDVDDADLRAGLERHQVTVYEVPRAELIEFAQTDTPQGVLFLMHKPQPAPAPVPGPFAVVLDRVSDAGNLGTILRTAWALGMTEVCTTGGTTDAFGAKAIRAGMGAQFALNLPSFPSLADAVEAYEACGLSGVWLTVPRQGVSCFDPAFDLDRGILVFGHETRGTAAVAGANLVHIPMAGDAESLNVAQAAAVLLAESGRRGILQSAPELSQL